METVDTITEVEIQWMWARRMCNSDSKSEKEWLQRLSLDCSEEEAAIILKEFSQSIGSSTSTAVKYLPALGWHGVSSRWKQFLSWIQHECTQGKEPKDALEAFRGFAHSLGRVTSYRALSLTPEQFQTIKSKDSIWPSGRLKTDEETLSKLINEEGARKILYARLYIGLGIYKYDPSLSLHDDPETAVCIAGGYTAHGKQVYLMEMSIPKIEASGYRVIDIQDNSERNGGRWFAHRGVWFDAAKEETERYMLHEIPFFSSRCKSVKIFTDNTEINKFIEPFKLKQAALKAQQEQATHS